MKRWTRTTAAAIATAVALSTAIAAPAIAQDAAKPATTTATTQKKEDDSFLAGLTALSTDDNGRLSPTLIGDWLRLIERVFSALNATLNLANRV